MISNLIIIYMIIINIISWCGSALVIEYFEENPYHPYS